MTTPFPLNHSTQIAEKSIEDAFNRQTYLGNAFILGTGAISLADANEHTELLISNSSLSGKALFVIGRALSASALTFAKLYLNPTISANGTPVTPLNLRPAYSTVSVANCYSAPTFTTNTNLVSTIGTNTGFSFNSLLFIIDPGNNIALNLIAPTASGGSPTTAYFELQWYEL
jgi:hypothetical protein